MDWYITVERRPVSYSGPVSQTPTNALVAEDGVTPYVAEDGVTIYVTET